jgi:hypothetical protein
MRDIPPFAFISPIDFMRLSQAWAKLLYPFGASMDDGLVRLDGAGPFRHAAPQFP